MNDHRCRCIDCRMEECRKAIVEHVEATGIPPTVRELAEQLGYSPKSVGAVHRLLAHMREAGVIESAGHMMARSIRLPDQPITPHRDRKREL